MTDYVKWKVYNNLLNSWIDKRNGGKVEIELDVCNYATKTD